MTCRSRLPLLLLAMAAPACAQFDLNGSVAVQSSYLYRGQVLSNNGPVPQLTLNLDHGSGWYLGGFASAAHISDDHGYRLQAYAGYAQRLASGWSWEAGCSRTAYTQTHANDFQECYGGLSGERLSARLYYAPHYLGYDARTVYGEANLFYPLHPRLNLEAHAGLLHTLSGMPWPGVPANSRYDVRLGVGMPVSNWTWQLARVLSQADKTYDPRDQPRSPRAWVVSAAYAF